MSRGLDASDRLVDSRIDRGGAGGIAEPGMNGGVLAVFDGSPIVLSDLSQALIEAAGGGILEEFVLDRLLERECAREGVTIGAGAVREERERLAAVFTESTVARDENEAYRLLDRIRAARGLGEGRFGALLRRNAMLRALVAPRVAVTPEALAQARVLRYGERYRVRIMTLPTAREAAEALARLRVGEPFSTLAARLSLDSSAARGGVIDPISPADPEYPAAIRSALRGLRPGELSIPIALDNSYAIVLLDERLPSTAPPPEEAARAEEQLACDVRTEQERLLMNQHARRLLDLAKITTLDRALGWSWERRATTAQP